MTDNPKTLTDADVACSCGRVPDGLLCWCGRARHIFAAIERCRNRVLGILRTSGNKGRGSLLYPNDVADLEAELEMALRSAEIMSGEVRDDDR